MGGVSIRSLMLLLIATAMQVQVGGRYFLAAWRGWQASVVGMDFLVSLGVGGAYLNSLRRLLDDAPGTRLLTEAARETVQERFSLDRVFGDFERLFKELAQTEGVRR
jgi:cation transport ATPase